MTTYRRRKDGVWVPIGLEAQLRRQQVITPAGQFDSINAAAHHHRISRNTVYYHINTGTPGWSYVEGN